MPTAEIRGRTCLTSQGDKDEGLTGLKKEGVHSDAVNGESTYDGTDRAEP